MQNDGYYYKVYNSRKTWAEARQVCQSHGAFLAVPWDQETNEIIRKLIPGRHAIIGINDEAEEGKWINSHGSPLTFTNWKPNEPSNSGPEGAENCGFMYKSYGRWNDGRCSYKDSFICQFKPGNIRVGNSLPLFIIQYFKMIFSRFDVFFKIFHECF